MDYTILLLKHGFIIVRGLLDAGLSAIFHGPSTSFLHIVPVK